MSPSAHSSGRLALALTLAVACGDHSAPGSSPPEQQPRQQPEQQAPPSTGQARSSATEDLGLAYRVLVPPQLHELQLSVQVQVTDGCVEHTFVPSPSTRTVDAPRRAIISLSHHVVQRPRQGPKACTRPLTLPLTLDLGPLLSDCATELLLRTWPEDGGEATTWLLPLTPPVGCP